MNEQKIFPIELVLDAMKDNGYKDAAYAVAELIDNSIQAGMGLGRHTAVELLCLEESALVQDRASSQIKQIAVYDNACGMDPDTLRASLAFGQGTRRNACEGIGKFGMGLPNASISQCSRVDVYSWQNGEVYSTYLDLEEIGYQKYEVVPPPKPAAIPDIWRSVVADEIGDSGTLVVWSKLDRLKWKRHKAFFSNVEFIIGRMYRYFINDGACSIRMAAFNGEVIFDEFVKANDPLYLMANTNTPAPFDDKPGFILFSDEELLVSHSGKAYPVNLKFSIADHKFRKNFQEYFPGRSYGNPGDTPFGKHCQKNTGISIVRAGRELELNNSFTNMYDATERFWGAEISFGPELDEVFGVTNNKQAATALKRLSIDEIAEEEGFSSKADARQYFADNNDARLPVIQLTEAVQSKLGSIRAELKKQTAGTGRAAAISAPTSNGVANAASKVERKFGKIGESDKKAEALTPAQKEAEIEREFERDGISLSPEDLRQHIANALRDDTKFIITTADLRGANVIFDVTTPGGKLKVTINESHPFYKNFIKPFAEENSQAYDMLKILFAAWALMEDKESDRHREWMLDARMSWGHFAKEMLQEYLGE